MDWLLGLEELSWSDPGLQLDWQHPLPGWAWLLVALAAATVAWWAYRRLLGAGWGRLGLGTLRGLLVLFVVALLAGPVLVLPREQVEPDWLVLLVDRSASLKIRDTPRGEAMLSRDQALRRSLSEHAELFGPQRLGKDRRLLWLGFDGEAYDVPPPTERPLAEPNGSATALRTAIERGLERVGGRPVSGVVLFTDGRSPQPTTAELVRRLEQQAVQVFSVPLGAKKTPPDLALGRVEAPERAFINDSVPVRVWIDRSAFDVDPAGVGSAPSSVRDNPPNVRVVLTDRQPEPGVAVEQDRILDQAKLSPEQLAQGDSVLLNAQSDVAGPTTWWVVVHDLSTNGQPRQELVLENNRRPVPVEFIDRPVRVLYVDGYPRWEYRYLKNMLIREEAIQSSVMLVSADPTFAQEGDLPLGRLPNDPDELSPFDVIIIGDVPANHFSSGQLELMRDHVAMRGAGLLWIGGQFHTPMSYEGTALGDLLPTAEPEAVRPMQLGGGAVSMVPTPLSQALNVLRLTESGGTPRGGEGGWPRELPNLWWAQDLGKLKSTAEVLARGYVPGSPGEDEAAPMVARLRYGAGQSVYVATDETWRWRYGRGDLYFDQFWTQIVQMLGRARVQRLSEGAWLELSHRRVQTDQPVVVEVHVEDSLLLERNLQRLAVEVVPQSNPNGRALERLQLLPTELADAAASTSGIRKARVYRAVWRPTVADRLLVRVVEPALVDLNLELGIEVIRPDDELRQPATDHARLAALSEQTGGEVLSLDELEKLETLVPNRARRTPIDIREALWDSPLALIIGLLLLTCEWVGRKLLRLV